MVTRALAEMTKGFSGSEKHTLDPPTLIKMKTETCQQKAQKLIF